MLECILSFREHLIKTVRKPKNRNNLPMKLAANAETLQMSAMAFCYSVAEYCAPVWSRSPHTGLVDVQLNSTMHLISGTLRSTPLPWLPVLVNIEPSALHRKNATDKLMEKMIAHDNWPIHSDITNPLEARKPLAGSDTCGHQKSMERKLEVSSSGQLFHSG